MKTLTRRLRKQVKRILPKPPSPWEGIIAASPECVAALRTAQGPRVVCATSVGGLSHVRVIDSLVAAALARRGAAVQFLLCDRVLPACEAAMIGDFPGGHEFAKHGPARMLCGNCLDDGIRFYKPLPFAVRGYREFLSPDAASAAVHTAARFAESECYAYDRAGIPLGEEARAGVLRFFGKATFEEEDPHIVTAVARRYLAGAIVAAQTAEGMIDALRPDVITAHHGVYVPQGVLGAVARRKGVRVVNWGHAYRNMTVIYSHGDTYHRTFMDEPTSLWENRPLSGAERQQLDDYLAQRRGGKGDWSWIVPERGDKGIVEDRARILRELMLDPAKPTAGLLTNVLWDAQLYYANLAFRDMLDWVFCTLDFFIAHPELQLIVRIHPHEVKQGNRQPTGPEIRKRYPTLPPNIKIIERESPYSTYALMDLCRAVLIYGTKTGVELAPLGIPCVIAGEAWIRNKGITHDVSDRAAYLQLLGQLATLAPLSEEQRERARRYAFHYFFRRMIPLASLKPDAGFPPELSIRSLADIEPGRDRGLDVICDAILAGKPFVYEAA